MKKFLVCLIAIMAFASVDAMAQKKGDFYVGANLGFGVNSASLSDRDLGNLGSATSVDFNIQPSVGYFVADRFMIGFGLGYGLTSGDGASTHALTVGPSFSYYLPLCKNLYYTPTIDLAFCYQASEGSGVPGFGLGVSFVGLEYRPIEKLGLSASMLSLDYVLFSQDGASVNTLDFGLTFNPTIGAKIYF